MPTIDFDNWISRLRAAMMADPRHHMPWRLRRDFYMALGNGLQARQIHGWLAILSAQRVLPLVLEVTPWEPQPLQDLDAAIRFLRGWTYPLHDEPGFTPERVSLASYDAGEGGYDLLTGEERADVMRARVAAAKALLEAGEARDPFEGMGHMYVTEHSVSFMGGTQQPDEEIVGDDEDWSVLIATGDAAGAAAVADSCSSDSPVCDPLKLHAYWTWWLDVAVPRAVRLAGLGPELYQEDDPA